jgi:FMN reductase (NADPH)
VLVQPHIQHGKYLPSYVSPPSVYYKRTEVIRVIIPLFGMTVGYPLQEGSMKPRLPFEHIYHEEVYEQNPEKMKQELRSYNEVIREYYRERTQGVRADTWTE